MSDENGNGYAIGPLAAALAKAQAAFPGINKSRTVTVRTQGGQSYTFDYAPLDAIFAAVRKPLADNELAVTQLLVDTVLVTQLLHVSGAKLESRLAVPQGGRMQELGSAITYLRRYALQGLLGIAAEDDDDGNAADNNQRAMVDKKPTAKPEEMMPKPKAVAQPPQPKEDQTAATGRQKFTLNGAEYNTAGMTKEQLLASFDLVRKVDAKHGKNSSAILLMKEFKVATRNDLDEETAEKFLIRLGEVLEASA